MTFTAADHAFMARALELAARGLYSTDPNPRVGCVLVRRGEVVGESWHERAGEPHAEARALKLAGERARGATAYVTLEPCAHQGRTPPCATALIEAGVARIVYGAPDPDPRVNGAGAALLRAAGIEVADGCLRAACEALNPGFHTRLTRGWPFVRLKLAASLDGRTALHNGESRWITSEAARGDVQRLRARSSAILTGGGTVRTDDPRLTVRDSGLSLGGRTPLRVVVCGTQPLRADARVFREAGEAIVYTTDPTQNWLEPIRRIGVAVVAVGTEAHSERPSLDEVLKDLAARGVNELLVECGPELAGAFLAGDYVDELVLYQALTLLGPQAAPLAALPRLESLDRRLSFRLVDTRQVGADIRLTLAPRRAQGD